MIGSVGGAGQAADVGFTVAHDRSELGVTEGVPAELASRWQESYLSAGLVVHVRELAVHLGRFEKLPIHDARTYHCIRTYVRLSACGALLIINFCRRIGGAAVRYRDQQLSVPAAWRS
ncbi:hypothetical protein G7043_20235 [Lentzea sp. NEAU-D13]|uniref:Uncharacterized protein n=1 Tax=Lentzea alba TaxID=2714351 RepID=A0A7C9VX78_9PSEU|nr:hypothetical protein [Lentzea alba]NGY61258.1 hypothetical protein [Lentzea alba]